MLDLRLFLFLFSLLQNFPLYLQNPRITVSSFDSAAYIKQSLLNGITSERAVSNRSKKLESLGPPVDVPDSDSEDD